MAISPLSNSLASILGSTAAQGATNAQGTDNARTRVDQGGAASQAASSAPAANRAAASIAQPAQPSLPVTAPPGTDPELWSVLTGEERAFFARVGSMGPLTYGRISTTQSAPPLARGGRLDVKV